MGGYVVDVGVQRVQRNGGEGLKRFHAGLERHVNLGVRRIATDSPMR